MPQGRSKRWFKWISVGVLAAILSVIPIRLAIANYIAPQPQAIFVLGGHPDREKAAAQLSRYYPALEIWVSSGSEREVIRSIFQAAAIDKARLHLDYQAVDTVTNFTTLIPEFKRRKLRHLLIITSDFHIARARTIALLTLGSHGITYTFQSVPSTREAESSWSIGRDAVRSAVWLVTGYDGRCGVPVQTHNDCQ